MKHVVMAGLLFLLAVVVLAVFVGTMVYDAKFKRCARHHYADAGITLDAEGNEAWCCLEHDGGECVLLEEVER